MAIVRATLELLFEHGYRALTMEQVRERAGVGKATIYRRYGSKEELVRAVVAHLNTGMPEPPTPAACTATSTRSPARCSPARRSPARSTFDAADALRGRRTTPSCGRSSTPRSSSRAATCSRRSCGGRSTRGEIRADTDVELAIDLLAGPIVYRILITGGDVADIADRPARLFDAVLEGLRPR